MQDEQTIENNLRKDLENKSIEELIYLNFNPTYYVQKSTQNLRDQNDQLLTEVNTLNSSFQANKEQYDNVKNMLDNYKKQYQAKEQELDNLLRQKNAIDNQISVEGLKMALKQFIDINYAKPKQMLTNDFLSGKVGLQEFVEQFKNLNQNYHYYSIIRDKLNLYK